MGLQCDCCDALFEITYLFDLSVHTYFLILYYLHTAEDRTLKLVAAFPIPPSKEQALQVKIKTEDPAAAGSQSQGSPVYKAARAGPAQ